MCGAGGRRPGEGGLALKPKFCLSLECLFSGVGVEARPAAEGPFGTAGVTCGAGWDWGARRGQVAGAPLG